MAFNIPPAADKNARIHWKCRGIGPQTITDNDRTAVVVVSAEEWARRETASASLAAHHYGMGRELFAVFRANVTGAEQGAMSYVLPEDDTGAQTEQRPVHDHFVLANGGAA